MENETLGTYQVQNMLSFGEILDAVDHLSIDDQISIRDILAKRIIEIRRNAIAQDICEFRKEFAAGQCRPVTSEELMSELLA